MRTRLSKSDRRDTILKTARQLITEKGLTSTEMEDIRLACGISRGGLYHHFANKRAVLDALVAGEVASLADAMTSKDTSPIPALLLAGSRHLGNDPGLAAALNTPAEKRDYLSALDTAFSSLLTGVLSDRITNDVQEGTNPEHVAELFVTISAHINRREILGQWSGAQSAGFAATSLEALAPLLASPKELAPIIADLKKRATQP
ncbi:MAG: TetR/AcrR family transcriptional regulator [Pelagimonas sp.]|uniref:TetR/AcrR family transcriptional regulator n=1 Tax=Pelagimonas sp. TaxID=2073170 RepID=UPI003D6B9E8E